MSIPERRDWAAVAAAKAAPTCCEDLMRAVLRRACAPDAVKRQVALDRVQRRREPRGDDDA
jgi:hypothetical protein